MKKRPSSDWFTKMESRGGRSRGARPAIELEALPGRRVDGFSVVDWLEFLRTANAVPAELLEKCPWEKFTGFDWAGLLFGKKELGRYCPWETFDKADWGILLFFHPEYRNEFEVHSGLKYEELHVEDPGPISWL